LLNPTPARPTGGLFLLVFEAAGTAKRSVSHRTRTTASGLLAAALFVFLSLLHGT